MRIDNYVSPFSSDDLNWQEELQGIGVVTFIFCCFCAIAYCLKRQMRNEEGLTNIVRAGVGSFPEDQIVDQIARNRLARAPNYLQNSYQNNDGGLSEIDLYSNEDAKEDTHEIETDSTI